jgi:hypothetical protein
MTFLTGCVGGDHASTNTNFPVIVQQPVSITVFEGETATYSVVATGEAPLTYQWKKNGMPILGATSASHSTDAASLTDTDTMYSVTVSGPQGSTSSINASLTVVTPAPVILTQPTAQSVVSGQIMTMSVSVRGASPLAYQWFKNGTAITAATTGSFSTVVTLDDSTSNFHVVISNRFGSVTSSTAALTVQAAGLPDLIISEISSCYYSNIDCWFEIYNPLSLTINLSGYTVQTTSVDLSTGQSKKQNYGLPSINLAPDGYLIFSGNTEGSTQIGTKNIKLRTASTVPHWQSGGFVELLKNGSTVDFVSFGDSTQTPVTNGTWSGANAPGLPSSATDYGKSIVRQYPRNVDTNTRSAQDWTSVSWSTPGGRNDVPSTTQDSDGDGIPDSAEVAGGTFAGIDLYAMGSRTNQIDVFIEVDQMDSTDPGIIVRKEALQKMVDVFALKNVHIHFDAGNLFAPSFSIQDFNLGQGVSVVPYEKCTHMDMSICSSNLTFRKTIYDWKDENMDLRRRPVFHYALFANSQNTNGSAGSSGLAETPGNDLIISLGSWGLSVNIANDLNKVINFQASTLMHEFGHNLGLNHGGNEALNYKPNYLSVMNYMYQLNGLDPDPTSSTAHLRWRREKGDGTPALCNLVASPCGVPSQFVMDYSNGSSASLSEAGLNESANLGRGSNGGAYADWDLNGLLTSGAISKDLNLNGQIETHSDYDDWSNLYYPFVRTGTGSRGQASKLIQGFGILNPIGDDKQPYTFEHDEHKR